MENYWKQVGIGKEYCRHRITIHLADMPRVAIARALNSNACVYFLADEPTGNLDETTADEIIALLKARLLHELGKCVVVVTRSKHLAVAS